jgi:hypothetical protein
VEPVDVGGFPYVPSVHDSDGNALGGLRLPHMTSGGHGRPTGAPLGTYEGLNVNTDDPFLFISGTFFPFSPARLNELYPAHEVYVERVTRAADRLLRSRHLLQADRDAYVSAATLANVSANFSSGGAQLPSRPPSQSPLVLTSAASRSRREIGTS